MDNKSISKFSFVLLSIGFIIISTKTAKAQMFSVRNENRVMQAPSTAFYVGLEPSSFIYKPSSNMANNSIRYGFSSPLYELRLELPSIDIFMSTGWNLGNHNYLSLFNIGAQIERVYPIIRTKHFIAGLPIRVQTDYLQVNSQLARTNADNFQQSSGTVGSGPVFMLRLGNRIRFTTANTVNFGFSVRSLGASSGSLYVVNSQNRLYFDNVFNDVGFSVGYDYKFSRYNLSGVRYDYALRASSIVLGITF